MSRDAILARIRSAAARSGLPQAGDPETERQARVDGRIAAVAQDAIVPQIGRLDERARIARFTEALTANGATLSHIASPAALPQALAEALRDRNLPPRVRLGADPVFAGLDWGVIEVSEGPGRVEEPASLSAAAAGIAEIGALVLLSGAENPVTLTFLGETHFVLLKTSAIEAGYEGAWARLRAEAGPAASRTVNLVAGPSRTADIGGQIELGAHGPVALHVFLIDDV